MLSVKKYSFISSFLIRILFFPFSCLIALVRTPSVMLKRNNERGHFCLFPDLLEKVKTSSPLSVMIAVGFLVDLKNQVEEISLYF